MYLHDANRNGAV